MSIIILGHPFTNLHPGEPEIFPESNARQGRLIADFGPLAGLLEYPTLRDLQPFGQLLGSKDIFGLEAGAHGSFKNPNWWTRKQD